VRHDWTTRSRVWRGRTTRCDNPQHRAVAPHERRAPQDTMP
jgi:hypothetical protein